MEVDENNAAISTDTPMEVDDDASGKSNVTSANPPSAIKVMASSGTVGSVSISLHPLVIMNVSEHWTRLRAQEGTDQLGIHIQYCFFTFTFQQLTFFTTQCHSSIRSTYW